MTALRQREPRVTDAGYLAFVRTKPCCVCKSTLTVQAAHIRMGNPELEKRETGAGERPSDCWSTPLCVRCHLTGPNAQHAIGERTFWQWAGIDPFAVAQKLYAEYQASRRK